MELIFKIVIIFTVLQRLAELVLAKKNERFILNLGGHIVEEKNYIFMVTLHTSWLIALLAFAFFGELEFSPYLFSASLAMFILGQFFRLNAIKTLGKRWSTRIVILPEVPAIKEGPFKWIRHPNYLGVILELAFLPLMASLYPVALFFSLANAIILYFRINLEEESLKKHNSYQEIFHGN